MNCNHHNKNSTAGGSGDELFSSSCCNNNTTKERRTRMLLQQLFPTQKLDCGNSFGCSDQHVAFNTCSGKQEEEEEEEEDTHIKLYPKELDLKVKIAGVGRYLPPNIVSSTTIDVLCGKPKGFTEKTTGIKERRWANSVEHVLTVRKEKFAKNVDQFIDTKKVLTEKEIKELKDKEITISWMGAQAALEALKNANLKVEDLDLIVNASGTPQRTIPGKF